MRVKNIETTLNALSDKINALKEATIEKIKKMQKETSDAMSKKQSKALGTLTDLNKKSQKFLTNLKAAVLILEGTKTPIFEKIDRLESEKKELLSKIKDLEKGGSD
jgi:uncharacterized protein (UPF0335 family)